MAIKVGLEGMPPLALAAARFGIGWVVVAMAAAVTRQPIALDAGEWKPLVGLCLLPLDTDLGASTAERATTFVPAIMTVAVMSTAFTGQAIEVGGFDLAPKAA